MDTQLISYSLEIHVIRCKTINVRADHIYQLYNMIKRGKGQYVFTAFRFEKRYAKVNKGVPKK